MKRISFRVAVAAAAVAAMAALTAGPASAGTVLCKTLTTTCAQENIKSVGSSLNTGNVSKYQGEGLVVKGSLGAKFRCYGDLMGVTPTMRNGNPLPGEFHGAVEAPTCSDVSFPATECSSVTMNSPPSSLEATEEGRVMEIGSASEPLSVSFDCDFNGEVEEVCTFEATDTVTMTLGENAAIDGAPLTRTAGESVSCTAFSGGPGFSLWVDNSEDGTSYVSQATETVLCEDLEADPCSNAAVLPAGTLFLAAAYKSGHSVTIKSSGGSKSHECTNFGLGFETVADAGQPLAAEGSYGSVQAGSCTAFYWGKRSCEGATINTPDATIEATGGQQATVEIGTVAQPLTLSITCEAYGVNPVCTYEATGPVTMEVDGAKQTVAVEEASLKRVEGSFLTCGPETGMVLDMQAGYNSVLEVTSI